MSSAQGKTAENTLFSCQCFENFLALKQVTFLACLRTMWALKIKSFLKHLTICTDKAQICTKFNIKKATFLS